MNTLYIITKWLTFPGAMVRALFEQLVCRICGIPVEDNRVLRNDELFGHVEHELAPTTRSAFAICFVPAFLNCVLATLLLLPSALSIFIFQMTGVIPMLVNIVAYWFAASLFANSYPLIEDAMNMKEKIYEGKSTWLKIVYAPGFAFLYVLSFLEKYCITFLGVIALTVAFAIAK